MIEAGTNVAEANKELRTLVELELANSEEPGISLDDPQAVDELEEAEDGAVDDSSETENKTINESPEVQDETEDGAIKFVLKPADANPTSEETAVNRLTKHDLLTAEEEVDLAKRIERGDLEAKTRFTKSNLRLVVNIAREYKSVPSSITFLDLCQFGSLGLIRAVEKFDYRRGNKFSTYAYFWIRQSINRGIQNTGRTIRMPVQVEQDMIKVKRFEEAMLQKTGHLPTIEESSEVTGVSVEIIIDARNSTSIASLDQPITDETEDTLIESIPDRSPSAEEEAINTIEAARVKELVRGAIEKLPDTTELPIRRAVAARHNIEGYPNEKELLKELHARKDKIDLFAQRGESLLRQILKRQGFDPHELDP